MDKIDAQIVCRICSIYNAYFELLLSVELEEFNAIKRAWDAEKQSVLMGMSKRSVKEVDMKYYCEMVKILDHIKREIPEFYHKCTEEMKSTIKKDRAYCRKAGLIVKDDDNYTNIDYYVNYLYSSKAFNKAKAILEAYGKK